jgi:putative flippase GtrA
VPTAHRLLDRLPGVRGLAASRRDRLIEILRFLIVGAMNWIVDLAVFNVVRVLTGEHWVMAAKVSAVAVATLFSWVVNRHWTFAARATDTPGREFGGFVLINVLGMLPPLACLGVSHYLLGLTGPLADNISANVVGLVLGTILRYAGYRRLVFTGAGRESGPGR